MTPVEETKTKMEDDSDEIPTIQLDSSTSSSKTPWTKGLRPNKQLSVKQRRLAEEAARAWSNKSGITWNEFTQNTTFHGVKYIFDRSPTAFKARRVLWILCVIASVLFFVIQVALRVDVYFEYNTNVDVEKIYTIMEPFPAVTICNQNTFRLTVASKRGLYHYLDAVFGGSDNDAMKDIGHYTNEVIDTVEFMVDTSHQLEDLIDSCTWKGKPCNMSADWVQSQTDMGTCYTFNSGLKRPALEVTESGAGLGLSLILNLEQYEYMMGPQNDAGIKILLHDQSEFPMIKDLGFAVAPGTHTLVGVNRVVVKSMEYPYGLCDAARNTSMSDCRVACFSEEIVRRCGCRDAYMGNETGAPVCDLSQTFGCVREEMEQLLLEENNCSCSIPCTRVMYEPSLSYAQLSKFSVDRVVLRDPQRRLAVKERYLLAMEVLQRTDPEIVASDNAILSDIQAQVETLTDLVDTALQNMTTSGLTSWLTSMYSAIEADRDNLKDVVMKEVWADICNVKEQFQQYADCIPNIADFVEGFESKVMKAGVETQLMECTDINCDFSMTDRDCGGNGYDMWMPEGGDGGDGGGGGGDPPPPPDGDGGGGGGGGAPPPPGGGGGGGGGGGPDLSEASECMNLVDVLEAVLTLPNNYTTAVEALYAGSTVDPASLPYHRWCLNSLDKIQDADYSNATLLLTGLMSSMFGDPYQDGLVDLAQEMFMAMSNTTLANLRTVYSNAFDKCTWMGDHFPSTEDRHTFEGMDEASKSMSNLEVDVLNFKAIISAIKDILTDQLAGAVTAVGNYRNRTITKLQMASVMSSHLVSTGMEDLLNTEMAVSGVYSKIHRGLVEIREHLRRNYEELFDLDVPLLNAERIANLSLMTFARSMGSEEIADKYASMSQNYAKAVDRIIRLVIKTIGDPMAAMKEGLMESIPATGRALSDYAEELTDYKKDSKMKQDFFMQNFLQVDVFYRELNSEHIVQNPSFAASSLLGEVGGFLGLLLGASVLTMCELFDYILMACVIKCRKKRKTSPR